MTSTGCFCWGLDPSGVKKLKPAIGENEFDRKVERIYAVVGKQHEKHLDLEGLIAKLVMGGVSPH